MYNVKFELLVVVVLEDVGMLVVVALDLILIQHILLLQVNIHLKLAQEELDKQQVQHL